ncbi:MAG TPA: head GIN domain-containing protein [Capillimicrobium sp.]|nr:head GIN domain-containing protein [Capillimicrobium sp.]
MLRSFLAIASAALLSGMVLTGCGIRFDDGPSVTETHAVGAFERIHVSGSPNVVVRAGGSPEVVVSGGRKRVDDVSVEVRDGTLKIDEDGDTTLSLGGSELLVSITAPRLDGVSVEGAGDVDLGDVDADRLDLSVSGAGDITGRGRVGVLTAWVDGAGDLRLADVRAERARVDVSGAGDVDVTVSETLDVRVNGSGDVTYGGDPDVRERVDGAGDVNRR